MLFDTIPVPHDFSGSDFAPKNALARNNMYQTSDIVSSMPTVNGINAEFIQ